MADTPGGKIAATKGNFIYLFNDGSFVVTDVAGAVVTANVRKEVVE